MTEAANDDRPVAIAGKSQQARKVSLPKRRANRKTRTLAGKWAAVAAKQKERKAERED